MNETATTVINTLSLHDARPSLKKSDLARVTIDTTVQPKNIALPTDARLLLTAIQQLAKLAGKHDVPLRQSYARVAKRAALALGRWIDTIYTGALGWARAQIVAVIAEVYRHPGPRGLLARTWPIGSTVSWIVVLLGLYFVLHI